MIIIGAGGLGKVALDIFNQSNVVTYCFLDDAPELLKTEIGEVVVLGRSDDEGLLKFLGDECNAFIASDDTEYKKSLVETLIGKWKSMPINAIHPTAAVSDLASVGYGNLINAGAIVNAASKVQDHCVIHSNALIEYDVKLADYVQVGGGSVINAGVDVGEGAFIGSGVVIVAGVKVGANARIGAGSVVVENVPEGKTVFGNPAKAI